MHPQGHKDADKREEVDRGFILELAIGVSERTTIIYSTVLFASICVHLRSFDSMFELQVAHLRCASVAVETSFLQSLR
jgi:hypothetical protein